MSRRVDIGRLLESLNIEARQRGDEWTALCPNPKHDDRKPSWRIVDDPGSDRHGLHHCYPCGFAGDAIDLIKRRLGVGYLAAVSWIEDCALPDEEGPTTARVEILRPRIFRFPAGVEVEPFENWPTPFQRYLERRSVPTWQVMRWSLAFALEGRLRGRIVIPTRSATGRLLSYTGRAIGSEHLRYLTPGREEGADTSAVFGEEHWGPGGTVVVCEGAFDALAVERAVRGVEVAVTGTGGVAYASDVRVVAKLARFEEVVIATDADAAGERAFDELRSALAAGRRISRARPPVGVDCAKMEPEALRSMIGEARACQP